MQFTKKICREHMRRKRAQLSPEAQKQAALQACQHFTKSDLFINSQHIAAYWAYGGELDPTPSLEAAWQAHKKCYLPVLSPTDSNHLCFIEYIKNDKLIYNKYGIPEPKYAKTKLIAPEDLDLVLLPLVAYDQHGNRLGMGAGYYDQTFAFVKRKEFNGHRPLLCGFAHSLQQLEVLPADPWDIPLDAVLTEQGLIFC